MPAIRTDAGTLHYRRAGSGPTLVLLHANPGDSRDFDAVFAPLAEHFDVIAPDWPGYGASTPPAEPERASAMYFRGVLSGLLDELDIGRAMFVGNSLGGYVATSLAIAQPGRVAKLLLVSPGGFTPHNALTRAFCRWQGSDYSLPPALFARIYLRRQTPVTDAMRKRAAHEQSSPAARAVGRAVWRSFIAPEHDLRATARAVRCPTLFAYGTYDPVIPYWRDGRVARQAMPHAQYVRFPTGHVPFAETPEEFLAATLPFLKN